MFDTTGFTETELFTADILTCHGVILLTLARARFYLSVQKQHVRATVIQHAQISGH